MDVASATACAALGIGDDAGGVCRRGVDPRADFGDAVSPVSHPAIRSGDEYIALDKAPGSNADIQTISFPSETALTAAPAPITSADPERMPAWSPGGLQLGFVRTTAGRRVLLSTTSRRACRPSSTRRSTSVSKVVLSPTVSTTTKTQTIGIFVVRVIGKRELMGRTVPRIRQVGRVPLGATRKGRNTFRWNGKVNGKRLKRGTYLLTYRALRGARIVSTSGSSASP